MIGGFRVAVMRVMAQLKSRRTLQATVEGQSGLGDGLDLVGVRREVFQGLPVLLQISSGLFAQSADAAWRSRNGGTPRGSIDHYREEWEKPSIEFNEDLSNSEEIARIIFERFFK